MYYKLLNENGKYRDITTQEQRNLVVAGNVHLPAGATPWDIFNSLDEAMAAYGIELIPPPTLEELAATFQDAASSYNAAKTDADNAVVVIKGHKTTTMTQEQINNLNTLKRQFDQAKTTFEKAVENYKPDVVHPIDPPIIKGGGGGGILQKSV
jgi:hypothetical protein